MKLKAVQSTETLQIDTSDYNTKFLIYRAGRVHNGVYTITAKNSQGEDSATVEIKVLGKVNFPLSNTNHRVFFLSNVLAIFDFPVFEVVICFSKT